ncbi:MFS transporter [Streptomyces sp. YH02]|uniref:MFS transporter n=1 Tax=Streptomyces sp. YH02 TaxID=3256999 RepID=UPI003756EB9B
MREASTATTAKRPPARSAHRDGNVLRWLGAYTASILGDSVYFLALAWAAARVVSPAQVGVVLTIGALPRAVLMLGGGVIADRLGPRRVVIASDALRSVVILVAAAILTFSSPGVWMLIVLALVFGAVDALFMPAVGALPPRITTADQLARVQGMRGLAQRLGTIAGPSAGGAAMALGGPAGAFLVAGLAFAASLVLLVTLKLSGDDGDRSPVGESAGRSPWRDLADGLRYIQRHRFLLPLIAVAWLAELGFSGPLNIGLVLLADERGWGPIGMGVIIGAFGAGAGASALLLTVRGRIPRAGLTGGWCLLLAGLAVIALGTASKLPFAAAAGALIGLAAGITGSVFAALLQTATDASYLGRVTSVLTLLTVGLVPLSYPLTGILIGLFGPETVFAGYGAVCVLAMVIVMAVRSLRCAELSEQP